MVSLGTSTKVTRRVFSQALIAGLCAPTGVLAGAPYAAPINASFVRSGKIRHSGADGVSLGVMVMRDNTYDRLQEDLAALDERMNFRREVQFSTTRMNDEYYENALEVMGDHEIDVSVAIIQPARWGAVPSTFETWRRDAELAALQHLLQENRVALETLKHDRGVDSAIYPHIETKHGLLDGITVHEANYHAPRSFQIANILAKSIAQNALPQDRRTSSPVKARMVEITRNYYDLPPIVEQISRPGLSVQVLPIF